VPQARAGLLPTLGLTGNDNGTRAKTTFSNVPAVSREVHAWNWALQLTQPLIRLQNVYAYLGSTAQADAAEAQYAFAEQDLILRVVEAYFDVLVAEEGVAVASVQLRSMEEQWAQAKRGFESGLRAVTDVYEAKSKADLARAQQVVAANELENKRADLEKIVGAVPVHLAALGPTIALPAPQPKDPLAWANQAREQHPLVRMQESALKADEAEVNRNRAEHLPTLDLTVAKGANYQSGSLTTPVDYSMDARTTQAGIQLNVPLFAGGATNAKVGEAIANRSKTRAQLEEARRKAAADAKQAYAGIVSGLAQIEALESAVISGESAVKGNQMGYQIGLRINSDVLSAEQQLYTSKRDLVKARYDVLLQGLRLKAAVGLLGEADLESINRYLMER
jgi:outer membrane protein